MISRRRISVMLEAFWTCAQTVVDLKKDLPAGPRFSSSWQRLVPVGQVLAAPDETPSGKCGSQEPTGCACVHLFQPG